MKLLCGDVLEMVKTLDDKSVNCVITSPPYWQLRDYGFPEQWGLEPTYQEYLEHLWSLMDEIWRVLKDDGTVWVNLGDCYGGNSGGMGLTDRTRENYGQNIGSKERNKSMDFVQNKNGKSKCLMLIPHRFAIGCIDRGWIVRNDIIWAKRNGMPESVTDRFSKKHEYFFFMVKQQKYYFDLDSIRKPLAKSSIQRLCQNVEGQKGSDRVPNKINGNMKAVGYVNKNRNYKNGLNGHNQQQRGGTNYLGCNPGDVSDFWDIPTKPSSKNHYATYNFDLIDKCIIAGCPEGGVILDPFNGTGTTTLRAEQLKRDWIGIDGSKEYHEIAQKTMDIELSQEKLAI